MAALTSTQKRLIYRDMITLMIDGSGSVGGKIAARVRSGFYDPATLDRVMSFYLGKMEEAGYAANTVRDFIDDITQKEVLDV